MEYTSKWWYRLLHRHFLTFSGNTHVAQKLPENYLDKIQEFLSYNIKYRINNSYELYAMACINSTPMYLHMPASTTVQTIKSKKVIIKTQGQKNWI